MLPLQLSYSKAGFDLSNVKRIRDFKLFVGGVAHVNYEYTSEKNQTTHESE